MSSTKETIQRIIKDIIDNNSFDEKRIIISYTPATCKGLMNEVRNIVYNVLDNDYGYSLTATGGMLYLKLYQIVYWNS